MCITALLGCCSVYERLYDSINILLVHLSSSAVNTVLHIFKNRGFSSKINCLWFTIRVKIASFSLLGRVQSDGRMSLALRFPENLWLEAKQYFSSAED